MCGCLDAAISQEYEFVVSPLRRGLGRRQLDTGYPAVGAELRSETRHRGSSLLQRLGRVLLRIIKTEPQDEVSLLGDGDDGSLVCLGSQV